MILCVGRYYRWCLWQEAVLPNGHWDTLIQENSGLVWMINTMTIIGMMIRRRKRHNGQRCRNTERWLRRWRLTMMMIKSKCIHNQCWNQWWKSDEAIQWWIRQCHRLPICFLTSDLTIRNKNQRTLIVRRAGLSNRNQLISFCIFLQRAIRPKTLMVSGWVGGPHCQSLLMATISFSHPSPCQWWWWWWPPCPPPPPPPICFI